MPDAVNPDRNSLVYVYPGDDGPADGDTIQFNAATGRWEAVQGGTSGPDAWVLLESGNIDSQTLTDVAGVASGIIAFDTLYQQGGTAVTWDVDAPTLVVMAPGWYCQYLTVFFTFQNAGDAATARVFPSFSADDGVAPTAIRWNEINPGGVQRAVATPTSATTFAAFSSWPLFLVAADELGMHGKATLTVAGVTGDVTITFSEFALIRTAPA